MAEQVKVDLVSVNTGKTEKSVDSLKSRIKALRLEIEKMDSTSAEYQKKMNELGNLMHEQSEIQAEAKRSMNDFGQTMSNINGAAAGLVGGISAVTSTMALLGVEVDKDDVGMIKMMTALQGLAQSFTLMDSGIKAVRGLFTALDMALAKVLEKTVVTAADTAVETANTAATEANTVATEANAAAKAEAAAAESAATASTTANTAANTANGAAMAGAGKKIGSLASVFSKLIKVVKNFKLALGVAGIALAAISVIVTKLIKQHNEQREAIEKEIETEKNLKNATNEAVVGYNNLKASYEAVGDSIEKKKQWLVDHKTEMTKLGIAVNDVNAADKVFITQSDEYIAALRKRVEAEFNINEALATQKSNLEQVNNIRATLRSEGFINDNGEIQWNKKIKIDGEKKKVSEWLQQISDLTNANEALIDSVVKGEQAIAQANAQMNNISGNINTSGGTKIDWVARLSQNLNNAKTLYGELQNIRTKITNDINKSVGIEDTFLRRFYNSVTDALESTMTDADKIMGDGYKRLTEIYKKGLKECIIEDGMATLIQEGEKDIETQLIEIFKNSFNSVDSKQIASNYFDNILSALNSQIPTFEEQIDKIIEGLFNSDLSKSPINPLNLLDDTEYLNMMIKFNDLYDQIKAKQTELNTLNQKSANQLTQADKNRIKTLENEIAPLQKQYDLIKGQAEVVDKTVNAFLEGRKAQQALFMSYKEVLNTAKDFAEQQRIADKYFNDMTKKTSKYGEDFNKTTAAFNKQNAEYALQIEQSQRLIQQYQQEFQAYDTTTERKIELSKLILQEQSNMNNTINASNLAVYEYHTALLNKEYEAVDKTYSSMQDKAAKKWYDGILGTTDYNQAFNQAQLEVDAVQAKMDILRQMKEQNVIDEEEYQARLYYLTQERVEREEALEKAAAERKIKIHETYYSAYESISSSITSLLSEMQSKYDQDSKEYKDLAVANAITDTLSGSLAAFMSGVKSGIPAPWNLAFGGVLAASTFYTGMQSIKNIRSGTLSNTTAEANTSTSAYETLAYETGSDIYGAVSDSKVYVTETDITSTQRRVNVAEQEAAF